MQKKLAHFKHSRGALDNLEIELEVDDTEIETISIHLFSREEFEEGQLGYSVDEEDNSLTGDSEGE